MGLTMAEPVWATEARRAFLVEADAAGGDVLLRVLQATVVQGARVSGLEMAAQAAGAVIRLETTGLEAQRAERLASRLRALPAVRSVGLVWTTQDKTPQASHTRD
jgi:acetolactate synthase regulatory subunit